MISNFLILVVTVIGFTGCGPSSESFLKSTAQDAKPVYVRVPKSMISKDWIQSTGFNRDHASSKEQALGWLPSNVLDGMTPSESSGIIKLDALAVSEGRFDPFELKEITKPTDDPAPAEDYHNYQALTDELKNLADSHPDIARLTSVGKSAQGREIWMITISDNVDRDEREPKLLYIANMHGDEVVGREISIYHIRRLLNEYGKNPRVNNLVNNSKMFIIASMNPDGFELRQRHSSRGVDLNRDFPDFISDDFDSPNGRAIETKAIMDLHSQHHFAASVNYHGGEVCFNLPWDTKPNRTASERFGDDSLLRSMGRTWADSNPTMEANRSFDRGLTYGYEWYEVDGGMQDWSIWYRRSMHATVELSYVKWPSASYLATAWRENQEAMLAYHERALTGVHLEVVDAQGRPVPSFEVSLGSANRTVRYENGYAHRPTLDGPQDVTISVNGRTVGTLTKTARAFDGTFDRVVVGK